MNKVIIGDNQFCGPAALSIISGRPVDYCAKVIGEIIGKPADKVKAVFTVDMLKAFKKVRVDYQKVQPLGYSIYAMANDLARRFEPSNYLVTTKNHYVVIELTAGKQILICDNHTKHPMNLASSARLNQAVEEVYKVAAKPEAVWLRDSIEVTKVEYTGESAYYVNIIREYENPEDNTKASKGLFRANDAELKLIVSKLAEYTK